nr:leucine-rich repeat extensin-like protein 5 [Penaeus vannamei]
MFRRRQKPAKSEINYSKVVKLNKGATQRSDDLCCVISGNSGDIRLISFPRLLVSETRTFFERGEIQAFDQENRDGSLDPILIKWIESVSSWLHRIFITRQHPHKPTESSYYSTREKPYDRTILIISSSQLLSILTTPQPSQPHSIPTTPPASSQPPASSNPTAILTNTHSILTTPSNPHNPTASSQPPQQSSQPPQQSSQPPMHPHNPSASQPRISNPHNPQQPFSILTTTASSQPSATPAASSQPLSILTTPQHPHSPQQSSQPQNPTTILQPQQSSQPQNPTAIKPPQHPHNPPSILTTPQSRKIKVRSLCHIVRAPSPLPSGIRLFTLTPALILWCLSPKPEVSFPSPLVPRLLKSVNHV